MGESRSSTGLIPITNLRVDPDCKYSSQRLTENRRLSSTISNAADAKMAPVAANCGV